VQRRLLFVFVIAIITDDAIDKTRTLIMLVITEYTFVIHNINEILEMAVEMR
jgi:hypothetical protein